MKFFQLYPIFLLILCFPICISSDRDLQWYDTCGGYFNCGHITHVGFPFWGANRPKKCGYPDLELSCEDNETTVIYSKGMKYHVLNISQNTQILTIAREDFSQGICMQKFINTTLDSTVFYYGPDSRNFTVLYGCPSPSNYGYGDPTPYPGQFNCKISGTNYSIGYAEEGANGPMGCYASIVVPVLDLSAQQIGNWSVSQIIGKGFEAKYKLKDEELFTECTESGGRCGFEGSQNTTCCLCSDGSVRYTSCKNLTSSAIPGKSNNAKGMVIGLVVGGIVLAAVALVCLIFFVRRKRRSVAKAQSKAIVSSYPSNGNPSSNEFRSSQEYTTSPSTYLSPSIPSYPSSKSDFENSANYLGVPLFSYDELEEATENFHERRELGDGGFGTVYYGNLNDGRLVAVKRLYENSCRHMGQFMNEIRILATLRHKNLVTLYGCTSRRSRELLLVYEYVSNGTVADHLHGKRAQPFGLPWSTRLSIAVETADALSFLHEKNVIHRDVKTTNILLEKTFQVKVADFGLSRLFPNDVTHVSTAPQGTPGYVDPEYYQCYQLTEKSDVYSFGVVLAELISSKMAVDITRHRHDINLANMVVDRIQKHALHELIDPKLDVENDGLAHKMVKLVAEVAFQCLQQDKDARPSMKEVLGSLKAIQKQMQNAQKQVVVDINECDDDAGLLKNAPPPLSPETQVSNNSLR
ncbi:LEAF RUST 10 DISEASE-RESISTANCE LOCUS RECEPTOR-LIKE PROTEIN KINASE-like 1.4 isoform X3 [Amaranthus tricolor]|uniref:LEAF RUST 10 DISEASE-RESISTANCE LOCUS RECEPTOR-LIKE PROTEIN KINASE-like 1.4 isoform X3 n=1 Tax=Amaranthus tricolor TaxID=29722 RepID=UPI00258C5BE5|nr:LEAF RUST 10 DISEASE-RESISTANCE LOCUS RECEPTOR-LIKE PROTEIN KINASE-like 1.4 isoform X3 [Amaranthus tricolor]